MDNTNLEKRKQDKCHTSFRQILNLMDLTDSSLEELCEKCSELPNKKRMIAKALDQILEVNGTRRKDATVNRPEYLCIFYEHKELPVLTGDIYRSAPEGFITVSTDIEIDRSSCISMDLAKEDVFVINAPDMPSNRRDVQLKFHPRVRDLIGEGLRNCVGYRIHGEANGLIIGFNYPEEVSRYDGEVMKTLAITVSSLSTLAQQITDIKEGFIYLIESLARASEVNDEDTGNHIVRVNTYAKHLAMGLKQPEPFCNEIGLVAQMHDVGKIHTPSSILRKPGTLNHAEQKIMQEHTLQGEVILGKAPKLAMARNIACSHHENYDGSGYPNGLKGDKIPLEAQIVKLVDVYDALRTSRPYKKPFSHDEAVRIMTFSDERVKPDHFNPVLLDLFQKEANVFEEIYENLQ